MGKITFAICFWLVLFFVFSVASLFTTYPMTIGVVVWFVALAYWHRQFFISVPEVTGLVTINLITGRLHPYRTGVHFRYPWEQVKGGNYLNLRIVTQERKETYPSSDGPLMEAEWSFQYRPTIEGLPRYIAVDESTINKGLVDVGSSFLSSQIAKKEAIECKKEQTGLEGELKRTFEEEKIKIKLADGKEEEITLEEFYGIDIVRVSLADLDYEEKFQQVRVTEQIATRLKKIAAGIKAENPDISSKDALNTAMIINKNVTKHVQEVEGEGGKALAGLFMAMATGGKAPEKGGKK